MKRNLTTATLLGMLIKWTAWAILGLLAVIIALYTAGSYRKAGDEAQLTLVRTGLVVSLLLVTSSLYGAALDLYYAVRRRRAAYLGGALGYLALIALGSCATLAAAFIIGAVGGNR